MINCIDNLIVLKIIASNNYLEKDSLFNLLNINSDIHDLKKFLIKKVTLENRDSLKFCDNKYFQKRILNLVNNNKNKVYIKFNKKYSKIVYNLDILELSSIYKCALDLSYSDINNVSKLKYIHTLSLFGCKLIEDVSELCNLYELDLSYCDNITDVSKLGNIHKLTLHNCRNIKDFSKLCNVYDLDLSGCVIKKLSNSYNVNTLNLSCCTNIKNRDLIYLMNVVNLDLSGCIKITNVSPLANIKKLNLSCCYGINDVSNLGNLNTLNLSSCFSITDVSNLKNLDTLNLSCCYGITDFSKLGNIKNLELP